MTEKFERTDEKSPTPNIVPQTFVPVSEQFEQTVTQELRSRQSQIGSGYAIEQINFLHNELHLSPFRRKDQKRWTATRVSADGKEYLDMHRQGILDKQLAEEINIAKVAKTIMMDNTPAWAGNLSENELKAALPSIWAGYMNQIRAERQPAAKPAEEPATTEVADEAPAEGDAPEPVEVVQPPVVLQSDPRRPVAQAPREPSWQEALNKRSS